MYAIFYYRNLELNFLFKFNFTFLRASAAFVLKEHRTSASFEPKFSIFFPNMISVVRGCINGYQYQVMKWYVQNESTYLNLWREIVYPLLRSN